MKKKLTLATVAIIFLLLNAMFVGGVTLDVTELSREESDLIAKNIKVSFSHEEQPHKKFEEFAVSEKGHYAVLIRGIISNINVNVYDANSQFMYSFKLNTTQHVSLYWEDDTLGIVLSRSNIILFYDNKGELVKGVKLLETNNNIEYKNNYLFAQSVKVNGDEYFGSNNGSSEDRQREKKMLMVLTKDGELKILYTASGNNLKCALSFSIFAVIILLAIVVRRILLKK